MFNHNLYDKKVLTSLKKSLEQLTKLCVVLMSDRVQNAKNSPSEIMYKFLEIFADLSGSIHIQGGEGEQCVFITKTEFNDITLMDMHGSAAKFLSEEANMLRKAANKKDAPWDGDQLRAIALVVSFLEDRASQLQSEPVPSSKIDAIKTLQNRFKTSLGPKEYEVDV